MRLLFLSFLLLSSFIPLSIASQQSTSLDLSTHSDWGYFDVELGAELDNLVVVQPLQPLAFPIQTPVQGLSLTNADPWALAYLNSAAMTLVCFYFEYYILAAPMMIVLVTMVIANLFRNYGHDIHQA